MLNHKEFAIDNNIRNYQIEKEEVFYNILRNNFKLDKNIDAALLRGLRYNEFTRDLNVVNLDLFQIQYTQIFKEIQNNNNII